MLSFNLENFFFFLNIKKLFTKKKINFFFLNLKIKKEKNNYIKKK